MKKILLIFTLFYSFNVYALSTITGMFTGLSGCGSIGQVVDPAIVANCIVGKTANTGKYVYEFTSVVQINSSYIEHRYKRNDGKTSSANTVILQSSGSCDGSINPDTGVCENPPESFCDSQQVLDMIESGNQNCMAIGGHFSYKCAEPDYFKDHCASEPLDCTPQDEQWPDCAPTPPPPEPEPEPCDENSSDWPQCADVPKCEFGQDGYPECLWPEEPPIEDNPDMPSPSNPPSKHDPTAPLDPNPETPPVETPTPEDGDGDVIKSIQNLNEDINELIPQLNGDLNAGFNNMTGFFEALNDNTIGLQEISVAGFDNINDSINNQNDVITRAANSTNNYLSNLNNVNSKGFNSVVNAIDGITDINVEPIQGELTRLYTAAELALLDSDVIALKQEYQDVLGEFRSYFTFSDEFDSGDFNPHTLTLTKNGQTIQKDNLALETLVANSEIVAMIVLFMFGLSGVMIILKAV